MNTFPFSLTIENEAGDVLSLSDDINRYITTYDGLEPPMSEIQQHERHGDGNRYDGARLMARTVTLYIQLRGNVAYNRRAVYKIAKTKKYIKIHYKNDDLAAYCEGYVQMIECNQFGNNEVMTVTIYCPDPYLYDEEEEDGNMIPYTRTWLKWTGNNAAFETLSNLARTITLLGGESSVRSPLIICQNMLATATATLTLSFNVEWFNGTGTQENAAKIYLERWTESGEGYSYVSRTLIVDSTDYTALRNSYTEVTAQMTLSRSYVYRIAIEKTDSVQMRIQNLRIDYNATAQGRYVYNPGDDPVYVKITSRVTDSSAYPVTPSVFIRKTATSAKLQQTELTGYTQTGTLIYDGEKQTLATGTGTSVLSYRSWGSEWIQLPPGVYYIGGTAETNPGSVALTINWRNKYQGV